MLMTDEPKYTREGRVFDDECEQLFDRFLKEAPRNFGMEDSFRWVYKQMHHEIVQKQQTVNNLEWMLERYKDSTKKALAKVIELEKEKAELRDLLHWSYDILRPNRDKLFGVSKPGVLDRIKDKLGL